MAFFTKKRTKKRKLRYTVKSKGMKNTNHYTLATARKEKKRRLRATIYKFRTRQRVG